MIKTSLTSEQKAIFNGLGLNEIQTILYMTSLKHGILSVLELSKLTGISRQQIYQEAERLLNLGLYEVTSQNRKKYLAASPRKLLKVACEKKESAERVVSQITNLIPILEAQTSLRKKRVIVKYYEGLDKIKDAYNDELEASKNTEVLSFAGSIDNTFEFLSESYWDKWNKKFIKHNSRSRMLVHFSNSAKQHAQKDKEYRRETRHINSFPLEANIDVFNNTVLIVSFKEEIAVWIESSILSQSYRIMFDTLWGNAESF